MNFADKINRFNKNLRFERNLPDRIRVMNPFEENEHALDVSSQFYHKFYNDNKPRKMILGINPGRFGAGVTGIPFTDTKRLEEKCGLSLPGTSTRELSSVFIYDVIEAYGGTEKFYSTYFISALSPLGFVIINDKGKEVNYNFYDSREMIESATPFIIRCLREQINFGIDTDTCWCLGTGKNFKFFQNLNDHHKFFKRIVPLEHPRYIMQYKLKQKQEYLEKYISALTIRIL